MPINNINTGTAPNNNTGDSLRIGGQKINANFAYIKQYADNLIQGLKWKNIVDAATTENITLSGEQTIDGVTTSVSRILVKDQTDKTENGIYLSDAGAWTRTSDADEGTELINATVSVKTINANEYSNWTCNSESVTLGTTNIKFVPFQGNDGVDQGTFDAAISIINDSLSEKADANHTHTKSDITDFDDADYEPALSYTPANDSEVVKSISTNGGTPQTPDVSGNVDLVVSVESAEVHTEVSYIWNTGESQIFTVADSAKTTDVYVNGSRLSKTDEWAVNTSTGVEVLITLTDGDQVVIVSSATATNITPSEEEVIGTATENATATGTVNLDLATFSDTYLTLTGNTTITVANTPASGKAFVKTATIKSTATESLTLPAGWTVVGAYVADGSENYFSIKFSNHATAGDKVVCIITQV